MLMTLRRYGAYCLFLGCCLFVVGVAFAEEVKTSAATAASDTAASESVGKPDDILAVVGETNLTRAQMSKELEGLNPQAKAQFDSKEGRKQFLKQWIDVTLLENEAGKAGLADKEDAKKDLHDVTVMMLAQEYIRSQMEKTKVTPKDVEEYYGKHKNEFTESDKYHLFQITVKDASEAEQIKKDLDAKKSFLEIAKEKSTDNFKNAGGDRNFVALDEMHPAIVGQLSVLKQDEISSPNNIDGQFVIVKYTEKQTGKVKELNAVDAQIKKQLTEEVSQKALEELKTQEGFKIEQANLEILKKDKPTPEELDKTLCVIGSDVVKISAIMGDLERIPPMFRGQLIDDFVRQFCDREVVKRFVEKKFDELSKSYPESAKSAKRRVGIKALIDERIGKKIVVGDDEIKEFYTKNLNQFNKPAQTHAHHILVETEEKAKEILAKLEKNEKFEDLAKAESKCPSAKEGGDLGSFGEGQMVPEFDQAVQAAEINKIVGPVKTKFGYHLIRVDERKPAGTVPLEEVKDKIKQQLLPERQKAAFETLLAELRKAWPVKEFSEKL
ncbi:MAG: peptidyl-prolyl cis-trans isomerase [Candidatus Riflebacteria bacterium]|nr:peptidyl-prolyl cis-trans isomerase [Candidatus Riflebacteria bacterium]